MELPRAASFAPFSWGGVSEVVAPHKERPAAWVHGRPKGDEANSNFSNHKPPQHFGQELEQFETVATWHEDLTAIFSSPTTGNGPKRDFNLYRMRWRLRGRNNARVRGSRPSVRPLVSQKRSPTQRVGLRWYRHSTGRGQGRADTTNHPNAVRHFLFPKPRRGGCGR
jgi:hypothetical protein